MQVHFFYREGSSTDTVDGASVALDDMKTTCGTGLIASGSKGDVTRELFWNNSFYLASVRRSGSADPNEILGV